MSKKILIADDSLTIQKVVGITLAKSDFELVQALNEGELFSALSNHHFSLVLLDFSLCESMNGYELARKIKAVQPSVNILVMLGTFDSVDEDQLIESGISEKVVKPFESAKFISLCHELTDEDGGNSQESSAELGNNIEFEDEATDSFEMPDSSKSQDFLNDDEDDFTDEKLDTGEDWVLDSTEKIDDEVEDEDEDSVSIDSGNQLVNEIEGWGMSVPGVIGEQSSQGDLSLPPSMMGHKKENISKSEPAQESDNVESSSGEILLMDNEQEDILDNDLSSTERAINDIEENTNDELEFSLDDSDEDFEENETLPSEEDLAYPNLEEGIKSKLTSLDDLASDEDIDLSSNEDELPLQLISRQSDDNPELKKEIDDDLAPDDFWATDDEEEVFIDNDENDQNEKDILNNTFDLNSSGEINTEERLEPISVDLDIQPKSIEEISDRKVNKTVEVNEQDTHHRISINEDELAERIMKALEPKMEEMIKKYASSSLEKVAWEIMPDLAENLIKEELQKVTTSLEE